MSPTKAWLRPPGRKKRLFRAVALVGAVSVVGALISIASPERTAAEAAGAANPPAACTSGTLVRTKDGPVCGTSADGVTSYLGMRYAAPPVGRLRWRPPQPVKPWRKTFQATEHGTQCPSPYLTAAQTSEDCLFLDVRVPAGTRSHEKLPVMVEFHGGGFVTEARTNQTQKLTKQGHVIVVYVGYRLGILGFMAHKGLGPHAGDYGLQDEQASLRWVKHNIARFGGNDRNVTIFGQSAGGSTVCDQAISPTAKGLFQKGISASGFYSYNVNTIWWPADCKTKMRTEAQAQKADARFAAKVGCGHGTPSHQLACLRRLPSETLVKEAGTLPGSGPNDGGGPGDGGTIGPIINGTTLTMSPGEAFKRGKINKSVESLQFNVGRDDYNGGHLTPEYLNANTPAQYHKLVRQQFGRLARTVEGLYPMSRFPTPSPYIAYRTIMSDSSQVCPAMVAEDRLASHHIKVYAAINNDADNVGRDDIVDQPIGAYHDGLSAYLLPNPKLVLNENQTAFQNQLIAEWAGYARTGHFTVKGAPRWTRYTTHNRDLMSLMPAGDSALIPASTIRAQHHCGFWDTANRRETYTAMGHAPR